MNLMFFFIRSCECIEMRTSGIRLAEEKKRFGKGDFCARMQYWLKIYKRCRDFGVWLLQEALR